MNFKIKWELSPADPASRPLGITVPTGPAARPLGSMGISNFCV